VVALTGRGKKVRRAVEGLVWEGNGELKVVEWDAREVGGGLSELKGRVAEGEKVSVVPSLFTFRFSSLHSLPSLPFFFLYPLSAPTNLHLLLQPFLQPSLFQHSPLNLQPLPHHLPTRIPLRRPSPLRARRRRPHYQGFGR